MDDYCSRIKINRNIGIALQESIKKTKSRLMFLVEQCRAGGDGVLEDGEKVGWHLSKKGFHREAHFMF
ncbi:MAG: hypothetical protein B5M51_08720 [Anaerolinea sp. 4484_236]|nr:MAG: hypothetical protein B5M51_08720 [Anaerolinea sp. 4484_236]